MASPLKLRMSGATFQGLQTMTTVEQDYSIDVILKDFASSQTGVGTVNVNGVSGTSIGTFIDTTRPFSVGDHPVGTDITSTTYDFKQDLGSASETSLLRPLEFSTGGVRAQNDTQLNSDIIANALTNLVNTGIGSYVLQPSSPIGTWTSIATITNTTSAGSGTTTLWRKTGGTAPTNVRPLRLDGTAIRQMTDANIQTLTSRLRNRIVATGIGRYSLQDSAPVSGGTWVTAGSAFIDTRNQRGDQTYTGNYTGNYSGTYTGNYASAFAGSYSGTYTSPFTGSYSGTYTGNYTTTYSGTYTGFYARAFSGSYTGSYTGNFTSNFSGTYTGFYARAFSGNYGRAFTGFYTGTYFRPFTGAPFSGAYTGFYTGFFTGFYSSNFTGNYTGFYARVFSGSYAGAYTGFYTGTFTGNYTGDYARAFTGNYAGAYTGFYSTTYSGTYTGGYAREFTGNYTGFYAGTFTGTFGGTYTGNFTTTYAGAYTGTYAGTFTGNYTGATILASTENISTVRLWVRIA